jgi:hypothetical protein
MNPPHDLEPDPSPTGAVREVILDPMCELFPPPRHLRGCADVQIRALAAYEKALAGFDRDTLQRGWQKIVAGHSYWAWPNPGEIAEACRQCQVPSKPDSEQQERRAKALALAEAYTSRYMKTSHLAKLARREGWADPLRAYVADVAHVQAQLLCGVRNIGWNARLAEDLGHFHSSAEAFAAYAATIEKAVARGQIRVTIPKRRSQQWRNHDLPHQASHAEAQEACHSARLNSGWRAP